MAWVKQYSASNVVGTRKLKALIFYTINPLTYDKRSLYVFEPLFGGLEARYAVLLRLIGKPIIGLFARCYGSGAASEYRLEVAVFEGVGYFGPKFRVERDVPTNHLCMVR